MNNKEVYMTALTSESYIPGVLALKKSLIDTKTKHPLVVLIPSNEANALITALRKNKVLGKNCIYLIKPEIDEKYLASLLTNKKEHQYWIKTFFKLVTTSCIEFKKIVLLDSDLYIQNNIDNLFKAPHFSAVSSRINGKLVSGVMVVEPSLALYKKLLNLIKPTISKRKELGLSTGDQDVFRECYPQWENNKKLLLPETYDCYIGYVRSVARFYKIKARDIHVIHFWGKTKPWNRSRVHNIFKVCLMYLALKFSKAAIYCRYISLCK